MPIHNPPVPGSGGIGDLIGPASSTDNAVTRFDGTTGKLVQNSNVTISDAGTMTLAGALNDPAYVTVASSSTCDIGAAASSNVAISGTTSITSFGTASAGITRRCRATGAFLITHNGTSLITCNGKNIVTKSDDCFDMTSLGSGNWLMTSYKTADGRVLANAVNAQTGSTYTLAITDLGNDVSFSNAASTTVTLPQTSNVAFQVGSKVKLINLGVGAVTLVKEGAETLDGNPMLAQYATALIEKVSATKWQVFGGTSIVNMPAMSTLNISITTSNTKRLWTVTANSTFLGITWVAFSLSVPGTFKLQLNGADMPGLTGLVPSGTTTSASVTTATNIYPGDVITIVADLNLVTVGDLNITPSYTVTY